MAKFLNDKEDVIKIELTSYGKHLFSIGKFNPKYYSFFDNEVVYKLDNESQNDIQDRILDTKYLEPIVNLVNKEKSQKALKEIDGEYENYSNNPEYYAHSVLPIIGTNDIQSDYAPAWNVKILKGELVTGSSSGETFCRNFDFKPLNYSFDIKNNLSPILNNTFSSTRLEDGTVININEDYILLEVNEENVEEKLKNFDIEIFEVFKEEIDNVEVETSRKRLWFSSKPETIKNGFMLDEDEVAPMADIKSLSPNYVQYYLDVLVDKEIDRDIIERTVRSQLQSTYTTNTTEPFKEDC